MTTECLQKFVHTLGSGQTAKQFHLHKLLIMTENCIALFGCGQNVWGVGYVDPTASPPCRVATTVRELAIFELFIYVTM